MDSVLDAFLALSPDAALAVDRSGRVQAANPLAADLFGYGLDELTGLPVEQLLPDRFRAKHVRQRRTFGRQPHARRMGAGLDLWGRRKDGTEVAVDVSLAPVDGPDGVVVIAAVRDMSERREEQAAQAELAAIVDSTDDAVIATHPDGTIVSWNQGAVRLLGYEPDEIVGQPVDMLVPEHLHGGLEEQRRRVLAGSPVAPHETLRRRRDGADIDVEVTLSAVRSKGGEVVGVAAVCRDISERVRARAESARAEGEREELMMLADRERIARDLHDVVIQRLFAAGLTLQVASQQLDDRPEVAARLANIVDELDATIGDIRSTIFGLEHHQAPATSLRARVVDLAGQLATTLGHDPMVHFDGPVDATVPPDVAEHALAVVREGLANVARHAHATASRVDIAAGNELVVRVSDNGVGIGTTTRRSGLRNLRQRAEQLNGSMQTRRPARGGTELVWRVPLAPR
jgi:PAS domain S-box-containing protein